MPETFLPGGTGYDWLKALHVISLIAWLAGMFYLPRLFVYHVGAAPGGELSETLKVMERRLLKVIINPAMAAAWVFGLALFFAGQWWAAGWMHAKLLLVLLLSGVHGMLVSHQRRFAQDSNTRSARFFRILNEAPTLLMVGIVILVLVKPF